MSDTEKKDKKKGPIRAAKRSTKKKKVATKEKTKTGKVNKNTVSQKAIKASCKTAFGKGSISSDALREASCWAKQTGASKEDVMKVLKQAFKQVEKQKRKRIMPRDWEKGLATNKKINRESAEY